MSETNLIFPSNEFLNINNKTNTILNIFSKNITIKNNDSNTMTVNNSNKVSVSNSNQVNSSNKMSINNSNNPYTNSQNTNSLNNNFSSSGQNNNNNNINNSNSINNLHQTSDLEIPLNQQNLLNSFGYKLLIEKYNLKKVQFESELQARKVTEVNLISKAWLSNLEKNVFLEKSKIPSIMDMNSKYLINFEIDHIYKVKSNLTLNDIEIVNSRIFDLLYQYFGGTQAIKRKLFYIKSQTHSNNNSSIDNINNINAINTNNNNISVNNISMNSVKNLNSNTTGVPNLIEKYNLYIELNPLTIPISFMIKIDNEIDENSSFSMNRRMTDIAVFKYSTIFEFKLKILEILIKNNPDGLQYINFNAFIRLWKLYPENQQFYYSHFLPENRLKILNRLPVEFPGFLLDITPDLSLEDLEVFDNDHVVCEILLFTKAKPKAMFYKNELYTQLKSKCFGCGKLKNLYFACKCLKLWFCTEKCYFQSFANNHQFVTSLKNTKFKTLEKLFQCESKSTSSFVSNNEEFVIRNRLEKIKEEEYSITNSNTNKLSNKNPNQASSQLPKLNLIESSIHGDKSSKSNRNSPNKVSCKDIGNINKDISSKEKERSSIEKSVVVDISKDPENEKDKEIIKDHICELKTHRNNILKEIFNLKRNSFISKNDSEYSQFKGLRNLDNSTFFNSVFQLLYHVPEIREYFTENYYLENLEYYSYTRGSLSFNISKLFKQLSYEPEKILYPFDIRNFYLQYLIKISISNKNSTNSVFKDTYANLNSINQKANKNSNNAVNNNTGNSQTQQFSNNLLNNNNDNNTNSNTHIINSPVTPNKMNNKLTINNLNNNINNKSTANNKSTITLNQYFNNDSFNFLILTFDVLASEIIFGRENLSSWICLHNNSRSFFSVYDYRRIKQKQTTINLSNRNNESSNVRSSKEGNNKNQELLNNSNISKLQLNNNTNTNITNTNYNFNSNSILDKLFSGYIEEKSFCLHCNNISYTTDKFYLVSIPLEKQEFLVIEIIFCYYNINKGNKRVKVRVKLDMTILDLRHLIAKFFEVDEMSFILCSINNFLIQRIISTNVLVSDLEDEMLFALQISPIVYEHKIKQKHLITIGSGSNYFNNGLLNVSRTINYDKSQRYLRSRSKSRSKKLGETPSNINNSNNNNNQNSNNNTYFKSDAKHNFFKEIVNMESNNSNRNSNASSINNNVFQKTNKFNYNLKYLLLKEEFIENCVRRVMSACIFPFDNIRESLAAINFILNPYKVREVELLLFIYQKSKTYTTNNQNSNVNNNNNNNKINNNINNNNLNLISNNNNFSSNNNFSKSTYFNDLSINLRNFIYQGLKKDLIIINNDLNYYLPVDYLRVPLKITTFCSDIKHPNRRKLVSFQKLFYFNVKNTTKEIYYELYEYFKPILALENKDTPSNIYHNYQETIFKLSLETIFVENKSNIITHISEKQMTEYQLPFVVKLVNSIGLLDPEIPCCFCNTIQCENCLLPCSNGIMLKDIIDKRNKKLIEISVIKNQEAIELDEVLVNSRSNNNSFHGNSNRHNFFSKENNNNIYQSNGNINNNNNNNICNNNNNCINNPMKNKSSLFSLKSNNSGVNNNANNANNSAQQNNNNINNSSIGEIQPNPVKLVKSSSEKNIYINNLNSKVLNLTNGNPNNANSFLYTDRPQRIEFEYFTDFELEVVFHPRFEKMLLNKLNQVIVKSNQPINNEKDFAKINLNSCLQNLQKQTLKRDTYCEHCRRNADLTSIKEIKSYPEYLILRLERFSGISKVKTQIAFDDSWSVGTNTPNMNLNSSNIHMSYNNKFKLNILNQLFVFEKYTLNSVICHTGDLKLGRCYFLLNTPSNRWIRFDDHIVYDCLKEIEEKRAVLTEDFYVMVFKKISSLNNND